MIQNVTYLQLTLDSDGAACLCGCISYLGAFLPKPGLLVGVRAFSMSERIFVEVGIRFVRFFVKDEAPLD